MFVGMPARSVVPAVLLNRIWFFDDELEGRTELPVV